MDNVVVLPAPFGPTRPKKLPGGTARFTPATAVLAPNRLHRPRAHTAGATGPADTTGTADTPNAPGTTGPADTTGTAGTVVTIGTAGTAGVPTAT